MMTDVVVRASQLAAGQWGLLTTAQAAREDITRLQLARLADAGVLERLGRGVYATTSSADEHLSLRAAWLALDPARTAEERLKSPTTAGVVSHASAAGLHNLGDLLDDEHEVTLPQRKQTRREGIRIHRGDLTEQDVTIVDGLPVTTEERTIADLLRAGHDPEHIAQIIGQGVRRGVVDLTDLAIHLDPLARRHGQPDGGALVEYLLDLVGLSRAALARELARSPAGQDLVAAGRLSAIGEMLGPMLTQIDTAQLFGLDKLDLGLISGLREVVARMQPISPAIAQLQELSKVTLSPSMLAAFAAMQSPGVQAAITAARSPAEGDG
ncbi:MAG TPA: type IV toxin-antitoxin system AbiEi family antitoxin domain-containing protein [Coriobacteriia bacterium]|nr:type IV toxin-antitoxin system AbiEi family antitoxin domain-containing protein [Coriobacteriia bacterium]